MTTLRTIKMLLLGGLCLAELLLTGCATTHAPFGESDNGLLPPEDTAEQSSPAERIDIDGLQRAMGMERSNDDLGYEEKAFNTCKAGYGYSSTHNCRKQNLVVIHFLLQCRDSMGTESSTDYEIQPVGSAKVKWNLGQAQGFTETDGDGYGQVRWVTPASQRREKLRLTVDGKFMILTASEISRVVAPKNWCNGSTARHGSSPSEDPWGPVSGSGY